VKKGPVGGQFPLIACCFALVCFAARFGGCMAGCFELVLRSAYGVYEAVWPYEMSWCSTHRQMNHHKRRIEALEDTGIGTTCRTGLRSIRDGSHPDAAIYCHTTEAVAASAGCSHCE
jgi:hypothetical protein